MVIQKNGGLVKKSLTLTWWRDTKTIGIPHVMLGQHLMKSEGVCDEQQPQRDDKVAG